LQKVITALQQIVAIQENMMAGSMLVDRFFNADFL
jgi:hypothetical protein